MSSTSDIVVVVSGTGPVVVIDALRQGLPGPMGPGIAVNSNGTSTVPLTFSNANNVTLGVSNGVVTLSASYQTAQGVGISLSGHTAGVGGLISTGTMFLVGGNNVTLSQSGNSIVLSGPNTVSQSIQPGIQSFQVGTATYTSGPVVFSNANGVSFGGDSNGNVTASIAAQPQTNQTLGFFGGSNTTGQSSGTFDARSLSVSGAGNISVGMSNGGLVISGPTPTADSFNGLVVNGGAVSTLTTLALSDANNVSFGLAGGTITASASFQQTVQTQNVVNQVTLSGNTSGVMAPVSSGTLLLAGGNNVTLSQNGNSITISGPSTVAQSVQTLGLYGSGNTTGDSSSGSVDARSLTLVGQGNISVGLSNGSLLVSGSVPSFNQTVQTQNVYQAVIDGNTSGVASPISSGTLTLAGGNNITLSQNGNAITISGPSTVAQTVQPGIQSIAVGDSTYTTGQVAFVNANGLSFGSSPSGITGSYTVPTQSNQNIGLFAVSNTTQSSSGTVDARSLTFAGAGAASVGITGNSVVVSVPAQVAQTVQTQNIYQAVFSGNTAGAMATVSSGTLTFAGGNNITLSQAGNAVTISGPTTVAQTVQTQNRFNATLSGNTAGVMAQVSSGTLTLAGGNNITLSQNGNAVTISGPNTVAQTVQTVGVYGISNTAGQSSSSTVDARSLSFAGAGNISVGMSGGSVVISAAAGGQSVQTQNLHNVTLSGNTAGVMAQVSSGTLTFAGGNNITLSQNGNAVTISGPNTVAQTVQPGIQTVAFGNTTFTTGALSFSNANGFSFGSSGGQVTASYTVPSVPAQTVQTQNLHNVTLAGNTAGAMAQISSGTLTLAGGNNITLSQAGNAITISGPTTVAQTVQPGIQSVAFADTTFTTGALSFSNANGFSFGSSGGQVTASYTVPTQTVQTQNVYQAVLSGNTAGAMATVSSGTLTLAGGNNITLSQAGNAVTISGPNTVAQTNQTLGLYHLGNTTGQSSSSTIDARSLSFSGAGVASVGMSGGTLIVSVPAGGGGGDGYNIVSMLTSTSGGGTAGATFSALSGSLGLMAGSNITLSQTSNTIVLLGPNIVAQTDQTLGAYAVGNTYGQSSFSTFDARSLSLSGSGGVSLGMSGGYVVVSAAATPVVVSGTATIDFGAFPGSNEASVTVSGLTDILTTSRVRIFINGDDTSSNHDANDHRYLPLVAAFVPGTPTLGSGFVIYGRSYEKLQGTYTLRWEYTV